MKVILKKIITSLRVSMFPTEHDKEIKRWYSDGGDEKLRYNYDLDRDSLVMDMGGYKGQWASDIYASYNCRVLIFEPVKSFAEQIQRRFKNNPNIEVFCLALGKNRRQEIISLCDDGSSVYRDAPVKKTIQFEDVAEFFTKHDIKNIDLMKINIEGGEYELLPRLIETGLVNKIKNIQIQFHNVLTDSKAHMKRICSELSKTHKPTYQYKFVWENWVRCDF
ncbi:MAG: FkbM family methyltransferase [Candidatus Omnitrophica bacterium]|nr:FkbM family methyltransferase [Candidatus Omnitrophota bacterium]MBU1047384.1 FkbM family methyltransferase [Candidatus Omnitrophota bacterium]MBU1630187.1 FkbM family methyltransferase [Candidatus Omnitrophota bacterium]MBU1889031.1 FkbM family methyltransferase [Candidatus Omnitrophota bacterium]